MAKVDDYLKCECCGGTKWREFNCNTSEENEICLQCGTGHSYTLMRDKDNKPIMIDGKYQFETKDWIGKGSFNIMSNQGVGSGGAFQLDTDLQDIKNWVKELETDTDINPKESYVLLFDSESKQFELLFGAMPELWDTQVENGEDDNGDTGGEHNDLPI